MAEETDDRRAPVAHPVQDWIAARWSPYAFADRPVPVETLRSLFEAARWAPSSYNEQPWSYVVARREEGEAFERLLACLVEPNRAWAKAAPVLALGIVRHAFVRNGRPNRAAVHDLGLASGQLVSEATARGLVVHQMIGIEPERAREAYGIPEGREAWTGLAIGFRGDSGALPEKLAARDRAPRTRKPLAEFVFGGRFGERAPWVPEAGDGA